jgi:hypothetical protein
MLLVVFGAGASYDSIPSAPPESGRPLFGDSRPPLANQLFDERGFFIQHLERFPACHPIVPYLRPSRPGGSVNVEQVLGTLDQEATRDPQRHRQLAAVRFYLQHALADCSNRWLGASNGITTYRTLLDQIRHRHPGERVCFVTFNYDVIFEHALRSEGLRLDTIEDYISDSSFTLVKIHGSVDWSRPIHTSLNASSNANFWQIANLVINNAERIDVADHFVRSTANEMAGQPQEAPMFPAIAIPLERKRDFECPKSHLDHLDAMLARTQKILFVGWRATDEPFLDLLRKWLTPAHVACVVAGGNNDTREIVSRLKAAGINVRSFHIDGGFSDFVLSRQLDAFLTGTQLTT